MDQTAAVVGNMNVVNPSLTPPMNFTTLHEHTNNNTLATVHADRHRDHGDADDHVPTHHTCQSQLSGTRTRAMLQVRHQQLNKSAYSVIEGCIRQSLDRPVDDKLKQQ
jgi:hypothetical protein